MSVAVPEPFYAVGEWYADFSQTSDSDVRDLLARADAAANGRAAREPSERTRRTVAGRGERSGGGHARIPAAASLVRPGRRGHRGHCAGVGLRPVRCGGGAGRRLQATRSRRGGYVGGGQGRALGHEPRRGPGHHPAGLAREPSPHRHGGPTGAPAGDPGRHRGRSRLHRRRGGQPGLLVVRRHLRVRSAAPRRDQRAGRGHGGRGDLVEGPGGGGGPHRRGLRGGRGAVGDCAQPGRRCARLPGHLRVGRHSAGGRGR